MGEEKKLTDVEKAIQAEEHNKQIVKEIDDLKPFAEELKGYMTGVDKNFYDFLAREKNFYTQHGAMYYKLKQEAEGKWVASAFACLEEIQEKKLFDMQCLWRADKITIPNVEACIDFITYKTDALNCPFIDPITDEDIEIYQQYLKSNNYEGPQQDFFKTIFLTYEGIKEAYNNDGDGEDDYGGVPEWYDFHNGRTGKGVYMTFPDVRGEKEMFYMQLGADTEKVIEEEKAKTNIIEAPIVSPAITKKPHFSGYEKGTISFFVSTFEDKETQGMYKKFNKMFGHLEDRDYDYSEMVDILSQHCEVWPIEAHYDWREALNNCLASYTKQKIAESIPLAYDQYKMYKEMGIPFETNHLAFDKSEIVNTIKGRILLGRKYNNEPEDFDF
jgi:hypothetical protein